MSQMINLLMLFVPTIKYKPTDFWLVYLHGSGVNYIAARLCLDNKTNVTRNILVNNPTIKTAAVYISHLLAII